MIVWGVPGVSSSLAFSISSITAPAGTVLFPTQWEHPHDLASLKKHLTILGDDLKPVLKILADNARSLEDYINTAYLNVTSGGTVYGPVSLESGTTFNGAAVFNSTVTAGTITAALTGNVTGNVTGTASGNLVSGGALGTPSSGTLTNCTFPTVPNATTATTANALAGLHVGTQSVALTGTLGIVTGQPWSTPPSVVVACHGDNNASFLGTIALVDGGITTVGFSFHVVGASGGTVRINWFAK